MNLYLVLYWIRVENEDLEKKTVPFIYKNTLSLVNNNLNYSKHSISSILSAYVLYIMIIMILVKYKNLDYIELISITIYNFCI